MPEQLRPAHPPRLRVLRIVPVFSPSWLRPRLVADQPPAPKRSQTQQHSPHNQQSRSRPRRSFRQTRRRDHLQHPAVPSRRPPFGCTPKACLKKSRQKPLRPVRPLIGIGNRQNVRRVARIPSEPAPDAGNCLAQGSLARIRCELHQSTLQYLRVLKNPADVPRRRVSRFYGFPRTNRDFAAANETRRNAC